MMTLRQFSAKLEHVPAATSWYLADLGEQRGKQELFNQQSPQKLKVLREHALVESALSSNRMEGVVVDRARVHTVVFGKAPLRDRDEEEVRGYREALKLIHERADNLRMSEQLIRRLHRLTRAGIGDAGQYKERDSDIIEKYPNGRERVRFKTVPAHQTSSAMRELLERWDEYQRQRWAHPLIALAAFNFDFLCIHPFRDGNGRVSRLLLLLHCYHFGYEVGRYISLERLIEESKERYYETLEQSSKDWHRGRHNPWPYVNYLLYTLKSAYAELAQRTGKLAPAKGAKTQMVVAAVEAFPGEFTLAALESTCPAVSRDLVRTVMRRLKKEGKVICLGRGPGASWRRKGTTRLRG